MPLIVAKLCFILHVCVDCMCRFFVCFGVFGCACMFVLRVVVHAFATVCCKVAFHIGRVSRLHVCFVFVIRFVCLCLFACFTCDCVCV